MKRITALFICILLCVSFAGCNLNSDSIDSSLSLVSEPKGTGAKGTAESSAPDISEATDSPDKTATPDSTAAPDTTAESREMPMQTKPDTTSQTPGNTKGGSETKKPDTPKETTPPATKEPPFTTAPSEPESSPPTTESPSPEAPSDPYAYPFNIEQLRSDCIVLGKSYGFTLNESLTPNNASWAGAETASSGTQGSRLKRMLSEMIEYYSPAYRESAGLPDANISAFNIYCEPTGNGSYRIYFLFLL